MAAMTIQQAWQLAVQHHRAGGLRQAESICRQILSHQPAHADALQMLGVLANQGGRPAEAIELLQRAIALNPKAADCQSNLGAVLASQGRFDEAVVAFRRATQLQPDLPEAKSNLANALRGLIDRLQQNRQHAQAIANLRQLLDLHPDSPEAWNNLAVSLQAVGDLEGASEASRRAVSLRPQFAEAFFNLGNSLYRQRRFDQAIEAYQRAVSLRPDHAEAWFDLGTVRKETGELDLAADAFRKALSLRRDYVQALVNLGNVFREQGQPDEAIACYQQAVELKPEARVESNRLYTLHYLADLEPRQLLEEHLSWSRTYAAAPQLPFRRDPKGSAFPAAEQEKRSPSGRGETGGLTGTSIERTPARRLRVGYISGDFRHHPVGRFLLPLFSSHNHDRFEIFCYSDVTRPDAVTDRLRAGADVWRDTSDLSDEQLVDVIRQDGVDILVDLAMHAKGGRLLAFARKPAPIQVSYLAYCSTTGLPEIDYRLTDPYLDPPGSPDACYSEKSLRLPSYWCYPAPAQAPPVNAPPALAAGYVTFGSLNNFSKVTPPTLAMWARLLAGAPGSRLLLHAHRGSHRDRVREKLAHEGVDPHRVQFVDYLEPSEYFRQYLNIDIALDPHPYGGGTTSCDALWMGVPIVTLAGRTAVSRAGVSILSNLGLPEMIARTPEQYVELAAALARDLSRLAGLRSTLRQRMAHSPLMDGPAFARNVEAAYEQMWHERAANPEDNRRG